MINPRLSYPVILANIARLQFGSIDNRRLASEKRVTLTQEGRY